jgi:hypothetical protein
VVWGLTLRNALRSLKMRRELMLMRNRSIAHGRVWC